MKNAVIFWSGGKDSSFALYYILKKNKFNVKYLLSTFNANYKRLSMHGIPENLIEEQSKSIGIPLKKMYISKGTNEEYEIKLIEILKQLKNENINYIVFGDIFLEDLKMYRDKILSSIQLEGVYPLWKKNTKELINDFIKSGFISLICCIDSLKIDKQFCGKIINENFVSQLNDNVDPCGENGEFHSFCIDGPIFSYAIPYKLNGIVKKSYSFKNKSQTGLYYFADIELKDTFE